MGKKEKDTELEITMETTTRHLMDAKDSYIRTLENICAMNDETISLLEKEAVLLRGANDQMARLFSERTTELDACRRQMSMVELPIQLESRSALDAQGGVQ